jgi:hypothetical protein
MATTITTGNSTNGGAIISSDNTGILELKTGTGSGTTGLTINASQNTTLAGTLSAGAITSSGLVTGATGALYPIVSGTAVTCAGQTSIDFTGIPSWVKRITVMFNGVSTSGTSSFLIRIGSGSIATANYSSVASSYANALNSSTAGFVLTQANVAGSVYNGHAVITNISGNIWIASSVLLPSGGQSGQSSGGTSATAISGTLDQIRITTVNGTDTFDTTPSAGSINIMWE